MSVKPDAKPDLAVPALPVADMQSLPKSRAGIQSVEVGFALLNVLAHSPGPLMLRDLAASAQMSAAKAHRYLVSFARMGLVVQVAATTFYELGPAALKLGLAALSKMDAVKLARERMNPLMCELGHTVALAVWGNRGPTIVHWEESPQSVNVNLRLGDVMPLLTSATGRCFAAHLPRQLIDAILHAELASAKLLTRPDVPRTQPALEAMLAKTRKQGVGRVVNTLLPGVSGLCAPVFDFDNRLVLGLLTLGAAPGFDADVNGTVAKQLTAAAAQLSSDLGHWVPPVATATANTSIAVLKKAQA